MYVCKSNIISQNKKKKNGRHRPRRQLSAQASIKHNPDDEWQLNNHFKSLSPVTIAAPSRSYVELSESPNRMEQQRTVCLEPTTPPALSTRHFSRIRAIIAARNLLAWGLTLKNKPSVCDVCYSYGRYGFV